MGIFDKFNADLAEKHVEYMSFQQYLDLCKEDKTAYMTSSERMLKAIGEPEIVDTSKDSRLSRIFLNRTIRVYPAFKDFYGIEESVERIVSYFRHSAQGLEEKKQILYLLGPVGSSKSSLAERIKELAEEYPIYVLCTEDGEMSPVFENPLGVFDPKKYGDDLLNEFGIASRYLTGLMSPWAVKRLEENNNDVTKFKVAKLYPSKLKQIAICKVEPGDENNQDISSLVGKTDIRKLEFFSQNDPDSYSFSGGLCRGNQGVMEFVEMFKSPLKVLHPLLTATQEGNYVGTEAISAIPFNGVVLAHCFSDDTELLTEDGWKFHDQIQIGDQLATMNKMTSKVEYQPALKKFEQYYEGKMYHFSSNSMDHLVTPNHKMVVHTQYTSEWKFIHAEEFGETGNIIPVSVYRHNTDYPINDLTLRLMVQVIADGSLQGNKIRFHLKKQRKIDRLESLLNDANIIYEKFAHIDDTVTIRFKNLGFNKDFSVDLNELSQRQAILVLREYAATDGTDNGTHAQLSTNKKHHADMLMQLAVTSGCKATCSVHAKQGYDPQHMISIRFHVLETRSDYSKEETLYSGKVFCFETENHTLIARRNGKILITGNSNESEWQTFKNNKSNEAFIDRVCIVKVPYCLRVEEEVKIYSKMLQSSGIDMSKCAPKTLDMMAQFSVLSRIENSENSNTFSKMRVYNGEAIKSEDPRAKSMQEYKDIATQNEGMSGTSTRFAYKVLSKTFNFDVNEVAADPIHLMYVLEDSIRREQYEEEKEQKYINFLKTYLTSRYIEFIGSEIQKAYLESYSDYGQNLFEKYIKYADAWVQDIDHKDPDTGVLMSRSLINEELERIEKPAGIANPKDFRAEVVNFVLRKMAAEGGKMPDWKSYKKIAEVIEAKMFSSTEDLLPIISFTTKSTKEDQKKHGEFVKRMVIMGYSENQVRRLVEWYIRTKKAN